MFTFLSQNLATILGSLVVLAVFVAIIARQIWNKKNHKGGCGCGCDHCPSSGICHQK